MKKQNKNKLTRAISAALLWGFCGMAMADNTFISYASPVLVKTIGQFAVDNQLGGVLMWEMRGDTDPGQPNSNSLLAALNSVKGRPQVNAFWTNWSTYHGDSVPGSTKGGNPAFDNRAALVDAITYSFMETHQVVTDPSFKQSDTGPVGTVYFSDPWSDLSGSSKNFCSQYASICTTDVLPPNDQHKTSFIVGFDSGGIGNFEAFVNYHQPKVSNKILKIVSIGGYAHDNSFETLFGNNTHTTNFINSVLAVTQQYRINGWDMDYENPNMTQAQSEAYLQLLTQLDAVLPEGVFFNVDVLAGPNYLAPQDSNAPGFAPGVLKAITQLKHFGKINMMTYDFHGAFDYVANDPNNSRTGFLTNLVKPSNAPAGYDTKFAIADSVATLTAAGVPNTKIAIGVPAYGRALMNVTPLANDTASTGLYANLNAGQNIPQGDLDNPGCSQSIPLGDKACSGSFTYNYIVNKMLTKEGGFVAKDWTETVNGKTVVNGSTAFLNSSAPAPAGYSFTVHNTTKTAFSLRLVTPDSRAPVRQTDKWVQDGATINCESNDCPAPGGATSVPSQVLIGVQDYKMNDYYAICSPLDTTQYHTITITGQGGDPWGSNYNCTYSS